MLALYFSFSIDKLQSYVTAAVEIKNRELIQGFEMQISRLISFMQDYFPADYKIMLDTGILAGQIAPKINILFLFSTHISSL